MKAVGMDLQFEPYGGPFDTVEGAALADIPMGEFWTGGGGGIDGTVVAAARAAGRTVVGAEAFTGPPDISKWTETPAFLKQSADGTYVSGANRLVLHHWVHQPFDDRYQPGMGMGWWGTHFNRHQTWAQDGKAFFQYLGRCQAMLQSGETPSDYVSVGKSQGADIISWREFRAGLTVREGRIVLSSGRSYAFLGIPHDGRLMPADVTKIIALVEQGALIVCAKPSGAPGLAGYPESDREVASLASRWTDEAVTTIGKGRLYTNGDVSAALRDLKITPLLQFSGAAGITGTARRTAEGFLFFISNGGTISSAFTASFRVDGRRPELWDAQDGSIRFAPVWRTKNGRTEVDLTLGGRKSVFVVFRDSKLPADHVVAVEQSAPAGGLRILKARFGSAGVGRWMDVAPKLTELAASGAIRIPAVQPAVFGRDPVPDVVKTLEVEYESSGKTQTIAIAEGKPLELGDENPATGLELTAAADGSVTASAASAVSAKLVFASGKRQDLVLPAPAAPVALTGPWQVTLASPVDAIHKITLPSLTSLAEHADPTVKYFSGTATYSVKFEISDLKSQIHLNLGRVHDLARVTLNGKDLGVVWQAPFALDITSAIKTGENQLEVAVTNTWHNRLVGDEQFPADFEWGEDRGDRGHAMKAYPEWFLKNQPRPEPGRKCFVVWYYHRKDTKLLPAGLLGPVTLNPVSLSPAKQ